MISQLTLRIVIGKKEHCIRKCGETEAKVMNVRNLSEHR